jgi:putative transposase
VLANDWAGLERLCRYVLRPPLAQERLRLRGDGRVVVKLKMAWHDGTTELVFEPLEFLEKLAAITPRPEVNLIICHGVLAPNRGRAGPSSPTGDSCPSPQARRGARLRWPRSGRGRGAASEVLLELGGADGARVRD